MNAALLSSKNMCWCTPQDFFDKLNAEFGLTLCADGFRRLIIRKEKDMATPYKECPHCGAHLDSGEKCECREEETEAKNSQKYACGLTEQDVESGWECPLDNPNETVERCEDCAFAKETD